MLKKLRSLIARMGEVVLVDESLDEPVVLMSLDRYEELRAAEEDIDFDEDNFDFTRSDAITLANEEAVRAVRSPLDDFDWPQDEKSPEYVFEPKEERIEAHEDEAFPAPTESAPAASKEPLSASPNDSLTDQGLIARIDRDIAAWRAQQSVDNTLESLSDDIAPQAAQSGPSPLDELTLTPLPGQESAPEADEVGEEKFYIEPVE